jgi:hypothetical protein
MTELGFNTVRAEYAGTMFGQLINLSWREGLREGV